MLFAWDTMHIAQFIISLLVIIGMYGFLFLMYSKIVKRLAGYLFVSISFAATLVCFLFNLTYVFVAVVGLSAVGVTISLFTNLGDLRQFLANPFKGSRVKSGKMEVEKIYNRELLYKTIEKAEPGLTGVVTFRQRLTLQGGQYMLALGLTGFVNGELVAYHRLYDICNVQVLADVMKVGYFDMESKVTYDDVRVED